ncbi:MAG: type VI secretion system baseplate subunit TssF [Proteobacteria bacterium]|nr:type VI secretion system baseplate subunit TssF [Pseudomonadota bacterium]
MLNKYYLQELQRLRDIAAEFARENPAIAPMLEEPSADPDVERLLEGVAFLTGSLREKLDDEFPEIIHDLLRQIWPQYLRPQPAATLIAFTPEEKISQTICIPEGVYVESVPVDGTVCKFRISSDVDLHPMSIQSVDYEEPPGKNPLIRVSFRLNGCHVTRFKPKRLSVHLGGNYKDASDLYLRLNRGLKEIRIQAQGEETYCRLGPEHLQPMGFSPQEALMPWPTNSFEGYRLIQEYFIMPEKFLFVDITGWDHWHPKKETCDFHIEFILTDQGNGEPKPGMKSFVLATTTAVNIFPHEAVPVTIDHRKTEYPVRPAGDGLDKYQIFTIDKVSGFVHGTSNPVDLKPFHSFSARDYAYVYHENVKKNPIRESVDFSISLAYQPGKGIPELKNLSFDIFCSNGFLPEALREGDICTPTPKTLESVTLKNIRKPTVAALPPLGSENLWRLTSLMTLNHLSLTRAENLRTLLKLFLMEGHRDRKNNLINERRIKGILDLKTKPVDRLVRGTMIRGLDIRMTLSQSHFAGPGDVYLFGSMLDRFLAMYASINTFTRLTIKETDSGETWTWPERMGDQPLM